MLTNNVVSFEQLGPDVSVITMSEFATQKGDLFSDQNHFQLHEYVTYNAGSMLWGFWGGMFKC